MRRQISVNLDRNKGGGQVERAQRFQRGRILRTHRASFSYSRFDSATIAELHRCSVGNPREFNSAAGRLLMPLPVANDDQHDPYENSSHQSLLCEMRNVTDRFFTGHDEGADIAVQDTGCVR